MLSRIAVAWEMASLLVVQCFKSITSPLIGQNWIWKFINHHDMLKSKYNCKYDYQWAKYKNLKLIQTWFQCVWDMIVEYDIHEDDIYNFNKIGFQMGIISTAKMVTKSD